MLIGFLGSLHCVGMCGPLVATVTGRSGWAALFAYHLGRLIIYIIIGAVFGFLSSSLFFFHFQQTGSIVLGLLIVMIYAFPNWKNRMEGWYYHSRFYRFVKARLIGLYHSRWRWLAAGVLNGFLPCGMVYLAAAGSTLAGAVPDGMLFMLMFGLGTLPGLLGFSILARRMHHHLQKVTKLVTPLALLSGLLLIARGFMVQNPDFNQLIQGYLANAISVCGL